MELVKFFFTMHNQIKLYHWQTKSYERHIASDTLFNGLAPLIDRFMEVYQGKYNTRVHSSEKKMHYSIQQLGDKEMEEFLRSCTTYLQSLENLDGKDNSDLMNIRDEMVGLINQTLYLFSFK
jgi:hypothetical protein